MKFRILTYLILCNVLIWNVSFQSPSQISSPNPNDPILLKVGESIVTLSEFKFIYEKNNANTKDAYSEKSVREYLDLFIKFKLKVNEAFAQNYHVSEDFRKEYKVYEKQLAKPYLTESKVTDALVQQAYKRLQEEIRASHILVRVPENASSSDTTKALKKIKEIRKKVIQGDDFNMLAKTSSEDPSAQENGGDLGWFTALQMVYQFEDMAYDTPVGQVSPIFRTSYGYHILKPYERRPSNGAVKVAHLMIRTPSKPNSSQVAEAKTKILAIEREILQGKKWEDAVAQYSEDLATKNRGGELDWFSAGTMLQPIEEAAFELKKSGDISRPVRSHYGFHLIRLVARQRLEEFEKLEPVLRQKVSRDSRSELNRKLLVERLKEENQFSEARNVRRLIDSKTNDDLLTASWNYNPKAEDLQTVLFSIQKQDFTLEDFLEFVRKSQQVQHSGTAKTYIRRLYEMFSKQQILEYEEAHLAEKYPEYRYLIKEYKEGILLFQIMEKTIWSKALLDNEGLETFFNERRNNYQQNPTITGRIFDLADKATYEKLLLELKKDFHPDKLTQFLPTGFAMNSTILRSSEQETVNQVIVYLRNNPNAIIELQGSHHFEEDEDLVWQRMKIVKKYLTDKEVAPERIAEKNLGKKVLKKTEAGVAYLAYDKSLKLVEQALNQSNPLATKLTEGKFEQGKNPILDSLPEVQKGTFTLEQNGRFYYIEVDSIEGTRNQELSEVRGKAVNDYQTYLETQWLEELRQKYPVEIFEENVQQLIKK